MDREILFERINDRVDAMLNQGLFEEVQDLSKFKDLKALKTVGYQEFFDHLEGKHTFERAVELVKRNSRVFAKKQLVWFKRNSEITWFQPQNSDQAIELINQKIIK